MFVTLTESDMKMLVLITVGFIFFLTLIHLTPNDHTLMHKYKRLDYIGSFILFSLASLLFISGIIPIFGGT